jgi:hypothetical protein
MVHILLQILAQLLELEGCIGIILPLGLDLFGHVHFVKTNDRLLELLVVSDVVEGVVDLIFELLLLLFLTLEDLSQVTVLADQPTHTHTQVLNDQTQVHEDSLKVSLLLLHLVCLLFKFVNGVTSRPNVPLELLDFIV